MSTLDMLQPTFLPLARSTGAPAQSTAANEDPFASVLDRAATGRGKDAKVSADPSGSSPSGDEPGTAVRGQKDAPGETGPDPKTTKQAGVSTPATPSDVLALARAASQTEETATAAAPPVATPPVVAAAPMVDLLSTAVNGEVTAPSAPRPDSAAPGAGTRTAAGGAATVADVQLAVLPPTPTGGRTPPTAATSKTPPVRRAPLAAAPPTPDAGATGQPAPAPTLSAATATAPATATAATVDAGRPAIVAAKPSTDTGVAGLSGDVLAMIQAATQVKTVVAAPVALTPVASPPAPADGRVAAPTTAPNVLVPPSAPGEAAIAVPGEGARLVAVDAKSAPAITVSTSDAGVTAAPVVAAPTPVPAPAIPVQAPVVQGLVAPVGAGSTASPPVSPSVTDPGAPTAVQGVPATPAIAASPVVAPPPAASEPPSTVVAQAAAQSRPVVRPGPVATSDTSVKSDTPATSDGDVATEAAPPAPAAAAVIAPPAILATPTPTPRGTMSGTTAPAPPEAGDNPSTLSKAASTLADGVKATTEPGATDAVAPTTTLPTSPPVPTAMAQIVQALQTLGLPSGTASGATSGTTASSASTGAAAPVESTGAQVVSSSGGVVTLQLNPENLGRVQITLHMTSDVVDIRIEVESSQTLTLLNKDKHLLSAAVEASGRRSDLDIAAGLATASRDMTMRPVPSSPDTFMPADRQTPSDRSFAGQGGERQTSQQTSSNVPEERRDDDPVPAGAPSRPDGDLYL